MKSTTVRLTVTNVVHTGFSTNGNPRCKITWEFPQQMIRDTAMTKSGAHFLLAGDPTPGEYDIDFDGRGLITNMRKI